MKLSASLASVVLALASTAAFAQQAAPAHVPFACPAKNVKTQAITQPLVADLFKSLKHAFVAALGPDAEHLDQDKVLARVTARRVDAARMADLAAVSGCAALVDARSSCANFFDPELGDPLSVFMAMKRTAPARRQFEAAIASLPDAEERKAAQHCIRLVGKR